MPRHPLYDYLPPGLVSEPLPPEEPRADCASCPAAAEPGAPLTRERPFKSELRCCTYHPQLPNFLLGRALERGGAGAERVRDRIARGDGVGALGVDQTPAAAADYRARAAEGFGRDPSLRCPYWTGGALACGIWSDRSAVCRTWHCRHTDGPRSRALWRAIRDSLELAELLLARACAEPEPPGHAAPIEGAPSEAWLDWYRRCAARAELLADPGALRTPSLERLEGAVVAAAAAHMAPLPERVGPCVRAFYPAGDRVALVADSEIDFLAPPAAVFALLSRLDGRPWPSALAQTNAALSAPLPADLVERLWRAGLLESRAPGATEPAVRIRCGGAERVFDVLPRIS